MTKCGGPGCKNEAKRDYCSAACRSKAWRNRNLPRCPHCHKIIEVAFKRGTEEK